MEGYSYSAAAMMAVFAASGSVVLVAFQAHKRLLSHFMEKLESELRGCEKGMMKKKVSFSEDVKEPSRNNEEYRKKRAIAKRQREERELMKELSYCDRDSDGDGDDDEDPTVYDRRGMPENRLVLYRGLLDYKIQNKGRNHLVI